MLPRIYRMHRSADFQRAVRRGTRTSTPTLVVHALGSGGSGSQSPGSGSALVGFVVSKAVGNSVVRNRVKRRLRHAVRAHLAQLGAALVVIRAKPAAADADFSELARDLDRCLSRAVGARC